MNRHQQLQFLQATAWLRPWTRRAAAFSFATAGYLPGVLRSAPLKCIQWLLAAYQRKYTSHTSACGCSKPR